MRLIPLAAAALFAVVASNAQAALFTINGTSTAGQSLTVGVTLDQDLFIRPAVGNGSSNTWENVVTGGFIEHGTFRDDFSFQGITTNASSIIEPFNAATFSTNNEDNFSFNVIDQNAGRQRAVRLLFGIGRFGAPNAFQPGEVLTDLGFVLNAITASFNNPASNVRLPIASLNQVDPFGGPATSFATIDGATFSTVTAVPLPATLPLLGSAILGGIWLRRSRRSKTV